MTTPETLYFPDTALFSAAHLPLLLPFGTIHVIRPVDDDRPNRWIDTFMDSEFCQAHFPHPLDGDRDRFLYLIDDIKNRKDDYAAQLGSVTLASFSEQRTADERSRLSIASHLGDRQPDQAADAAAERRWHARLVLSIGELLDIEEFEVSLALAELHDSESMLLSRLRGDDDDEEQSLTKALSAMVAAKTSQSPQTAKNRLLAWFRFIQDAKLPQCPVWSATREEIGDILAENHTNRHSVPPELLATLELPLLTASGTQDLNAQVASFKADHDEQLRFFFEKIAEEGPVERFREELASFLQSWQTLLDEKFPAGEYGRGVMQCLRFQEKLSSYVGLKEAGKIEAPRMLALFSITG